MWWATFLTPEVPELRVGRVTGSRSIQGWQQVLILLAPHFPSGMWDGDSRARAWEAIEWSLDPTAPE